MTVIIKQSLPKQRAPCYFKEMLYYCLLFCFSLMYVPVYVVEAKTKTTAVKSGQLQQKKGTKKQKGKSTKSEKRSCNIIAYTSLCLESPRKLAKYSAFYHPSAHCIGLDISQINITSHESIMQSIYCGRRLKSFTKDSEKSTWPLIQRYAAAQFLAEVDFHIYQNYKKEQGNYGSSQHGILTNLLTNAIMDSSQAVRFKKQDAIFDRMLPYITGLYAMQKQVQCSKFNLIMLSTAAPLLWEPTTF